MTPFVRKVILPLVLTLVAVFVQGSVLRLILPNFFVPNLALILVVFLGFYEVTPGGAITVFLMGLIFDTCSGVLIGPSAGAYIATFGLLAALSTRMFADSPAALFVAVFGSTLLYNVVFATLVYQFSTSLSNSLSGVLAEAAMTALVAPMLFPTLRRLMIMKERKSHRVVRTRSSLAPP